MVKHADSQHRGCEFGSSMCRNRYAIGEEGNGKPPHEFHFPRKNSEPCLEIEHAIPVSGFCYARNRACDAVNYQPQNGSIHLENSNDYFSTHFALTMGLGHRFQSFMVIKFDC